MNTKLKIVVLVASVLIAITAVSQAQTFGDGIRGTRPPAIFDPSPQYAVYVKVKGIDGESKDKNHKEWIDALAYEFSGEESPEDLTTQNTGLSKLSDFRIKKHLDKASPPLAGALQAGTRFNVTVDVVGDDGSYMRYELEDARVVSYSSHANPGSGQDRPTEEVAFRYTRLLSKYTEYDRRGSPAGTIESEWIRDLAD